MAADREEMPGGVVESWIGRGNSALHRGVGTWGVAILGMAATSLALSGLLPFSQAAGLFPGADLAGVVGVGLFFCLVLATTYAAIGATAACSGSDYVLASRVIGAPLAFASSWAFVLISGLAAGWLVAFILRVPIPVFGKLAAGFDSGSGLANAVSLLQTPQVMILAGTTIIVLAYVGLFLPQRSLIRILALGSLVVLAGWGVMDVVFASASPRAFSQAWDRVMGAGAFASVLPAAQRLGFQPGAGGLQTVLLAGAMIGLFVFLGFSITTQMAGEVKKPERSLLRGSWLGLVIVGAVLAGTVVLVQRVTPAGWLAAQSFLSQQAADQAAALPWIYFYGGVLLNNLPVLIFLVATWIFGLVLVVQAFMLFASRIMLAWADDGLLPDGMAYVHPRFRSPLVTLLGSAVLVQVGLMDSLSGGLLGARENYAYFMAITMLLPVLAMTLFPFLKRSWFEASPKFVRRKIGPLPVVSLVGLVNLAYLAWFIAAPWFSPNALSPDGSTAWIVFGVMVACGLGWFFARKLVLQARGVKMEEKLQKLPRSI